MATQERKLALLPPKHPATQAPHERLLKIKSAPVTCNRHRRHVSLAHNSEPSSGKCTTPTLTLRPLQSQRPCCSHVADRKPLPRRLRSQVGIARGSATCLMLTVTWIMPIWNSTPHCDQGGRHRTTHSLDSTTLTPTPNAGGIRKNAYSDRIRSDLPAIVIVTSAALKTGLSRWRS
jgi:hypothetical protein